MSEALECRGAGWREVGDDGVEGAGWGGGGGGAVGSELHLKQLAVVSNCS